MREFTRSQSFLVLEHSSQLIPTNNLRQQSAINIALLQGCVLFPLTKDVASILHPPVEKMYIGLVFLIPEGVWELNLIVMEHVRKDEKVRIRLINRYEDYSVLRTYQLFHSIDALLVHMQSRQPNPHELITIPNNAPNTHICNR